MDQTEKSENIFQTLFICSGKQNQLKKANQKKVVIVMVVLKGCGTTLPISPCMSHVSLITLTCSSLTLVIDEVFVGAVFLVCLLCFFDCFNCISLNNLPALAFALAFCLWQIFLFLIQA